MDVNSAVAIIKRRLGNRVNDENAILDEMALVQETTLERNDLMPWFLLSSWVTFDEGDLTFDGDVGTYTMPTDFLREAEAYPLQEYTTTDGINSYTNCCKESAWAALQGKNHGLGIKFYALGATTIEIMPLDSTETYDFRWRYFAKDTVPALSGAENQWLKYAADLVIAETLVSIGEVLRVEDGTMRGYQTAVSRGWRRLQTDNEARAHANRVYSAGEDILYGP